MKQVETYLPCDEYDDLYKTVKHKKLYVERFHGDSVDTKMWIQDGKLFSQMTGNLLIKQIKPVSELKLEGFTATSGFGKSLFYLVNIRQVPTEIANDILHQLYRINNIPKTIELPKQLLDSIRKAS